MADMSKAYAALQKADAAGNTVDAKQIADYIRSQSSSNTAPKQDLTSSGIPVSPKQPVQDQATSGNPIVGVSEAGIGTLGGMAEAAVAMPFGVAKDVYERTFGHGKSGVSNADEYAGQAMDYLESILHTQPRTETGKNYMNKIGDIASSIPAFIPEVAGVSDIPKNLSMAASKSKTALSVKALDKFGGLPIKNAGAEIKKDVTQAAKYHDIAAVKTEQAVRRQEQASQSAEAKRAKVQADIAKPEKDVGSLQDIGTTLRTVIDDTMTEARNVRESAGNKLFAEAEQSANQKIAEGHSINLSEVESHINDLLKDSENIPTVHSKLLEFKNALKVSKGERPTLIMDANGKPLVQGDAVGANPMTFKRAELLRRYLNDVASGNVEGFSGIPRRVARKAVIALNKAMGDFVPEFSKYKNTYAELSKPLDAMNTRLGEAVANKQGGLKEDQYSSVAASDLPAKFFTKQDNIDMLSDMLSGGKNATPEARAAAETQVQELGLRYFRAAFKDKAPEDVLKEIRSSKMRPSMEAMPEVQKRLESKFEYKAQQVAREKQLAEKSKNALKEADKLNKIVQKNKETARDLRETMFHGDSVLRAGGRDAQRVALKSYQDAFIKARKEGGISDRQYDTIMQMMRRVRSYDGKIGLMKKALSTVILLGFGYEAYRGASITGEALTGH